MRMTHNYDIYGNTESSIIYLAKPGKRFFCALGGIDTSTVSVALRTNNTAELTFTIDKYVDGVESPGYEELDEMMELYCDGIWYKIMDPPTETNDGMQCTKDITAESYEISLTQYKLKNFKINMGEEDSYEMMYQVSHDTSKFYQIKFYDPENEGLSFLDLVLKHADVPGWKIGYVDNITPDDDGVLLPNGICNFDVDDQNVYAFLTQEAAPAYKCVFEFDTENLLINVYKPDSLGKDTNVVLGFRNIQDSVTISRDDSLVTQFYVEGLDDYNIDLANFGDSVITDLSYFCREPYMNAILQEKYTAWQEYRESRRDEYCELSREYNKNLDVLAELTNRVPVDTAQTNWFGQKVEDLKDAYDSNMAIIKGLESIHVDEEGNFDLEDLKNSSDWSLYESIMNYTLPAIVAALQAQGETVEGFGKGNIISCINPVVLGQDWYMVGSGTASFQTVQINDAPAYGITRGVQVTGTDGGIYQHNISIEPSQRYTLSCFVKGSGTFYLGYNNTGEDRKNVAYGLTSSWTRVYTSFNLSSHLIDVAFTGSSDFTVCGMQLEMGDVPSQFGYFTQSESIMKAYETDWKLYGIAELKTKIATYDSCIKELKKNGYADGYNPLSGYEEAYFTQMHQKYLDYLNLKEQAEAALAERQAEYDAAEKPEIQEKRNQIAKDVLMENFGKVQDKYPAFTDKETYIIKSLYNQATYTNENIIITTLDSTSDAVDKAITLYKDAVEELYVESHPQYTYTDEIGNIYALPEFREYHKQLAVNDFVRLGLSDTRYVKLRVVEITYNPCDMDENMEVTFSNMVQYKSKLTNDNEFLTNALNQTSNRNGGRVNSVNKSTTSDYVITSDAIKQIFSNPLFNSMLGGATTGGAGSGGTITADTIVAELVKAKEGVFDKLTVDTAFMKYLDVKLISADKITTRILEAEQANIEKLSAKIIESNEIYADMIDVKKIFAGNAGVGNLTAFNITAENVTIDEATVKELIAKKMTVGDLATQTAEARQIVLISKDDKPGIAFKDSTQQFYDSAGNVRVQIGQDGNGDFNFIVRGEDGSTALFDSKGIKRDGIPESTIINEMIEAGTVSKDRLNFKINTNEQGGLDITEIYDGEGGKWGEQYTSFKDSTTEQIKNITDPEKGQIVTSISKAFFGEDGKTISDAYSMFTQTIDEIKTTISDNKVDADGKIEANTSSITQNADKISFMVTGDKESEFQVTNKFIQMISDTIGIKANNINIDGIITAMNNSIDSSTTRINGGIIDTNTVNAMLIAAQLLKSKNYNGPSVVDGIYAQAGLQINMETGAMTAKNFAIDDEGNAYFKGNGEFEGSITANEGHIGGTNGFVIKAGKLYSGMDSFNSDTTPGVYVGTDGIALGGGNFSVDKYGNIIAKSGEFKGKIEADTGYIGGWDIQGNSLTANNGSMSLSPDGIRWGDYLNINSQGATFKGDIIANSLTLGAGSTVSGLSYNDLEDTPTIPTNLDLYITKDGTISDTLDEDEEPREGYNAFRVSKNGLLQASNAVIFGTIYASNGTFAGDVTAKTMTAKQSYSIYYNDVNGVPTDSREIIYATNWGLSSGDLRFGLSDECGYMISTDVMNRSTLKIMGEELLITSPMQIQNSCLVHSQFVIDTKNGSIPYQNIKWTPYEVNSYGNPTYLNYDNQDYFSYNGYGHNHTLLPNTEGGCAIGIGNIDKQDEDVTATWCVMPYSIHTEKDTDDNANGIPVITSIKRDESATMNIGSINNKFNCIYVKAINLNGTRYTSLSSDSKTDTSGLVENTIRIGTKNADGTTNGSGAGAGNTYKVYSKSKWKYNNADLNELPITCNTIGAALKDHTHSQYLTSHRKWGLSIKNSELSLVPNGGTTSIILPTNSDGGTTYSAGSGISIYSNTISVDYNDLYVRKLYHNSDTSIYVKVETDNGRYLGPYDSGQMNLGDANCKWKNIWGKDGNITGSDEELKTQISKINDIPNIESVYMNLNPIKYKYKNFDSEEEHDRFHFGFGARETEKIFNDNNLKTSDYGLICKDTLLKPNKAGNIVEYALRYGEFVALNTHMTQKAHHRIDSLEQSLTTALSTIETLKQEIETLKQAMA